MVEQLREAGAVLVAKLTTGEFAHGDRHLPGQTKNPWNPAVGSSGSSAGPAAATAGVDVWLSIGTHSKGGAIAEDETPAQRHSEMANLAGYPALAIPNDFIGRR